MNVLYGDELCVQGIASSFIQSLLVNVLKIIGPAGDSKAQQSSAGFSANDPAQTVVWGGRLPSRRRAITGGLSGLAIGRPSIS